MRTVRGRSLLCACGVAMASALSLAAAAPPAGAPVDGRASALASAYNASGQQLFAQFAAAPSNVVFSPYSIGAAMAMALAGARGATETEMLSVLQHKLSPADVNAANAELLAVLDAYDASAAPPKCPPSATFSDGQCEAPKRAGGSCPFPLQAKGDMCVAPPAPRPSAKVAAANALAIGSGGPPVAADYLKLLQRDYAAEVFRNATMTDVNDWVSRKTDGRIDAILSQPLDENAVVLLNAVYFNAHWRSEFLASSTVDDAFHLDRAQTVQTPTMHKTENLAFVQGHGFGAVALPYDVGGVEMVVVLPNAIDGLDAVAASLDAPRLGALFADLGAAESDKVDLDAAEVQDPLQGRPCRAGVRAPGDVQGVPSRRRRFQRRHRPAAQRAKGVDRTNRPSRHDRRDGGRNRSGGRHRGRRAICGGLRAADQGADPVPCRPPIPVLRGREDDRLDPVRGPHRRSAIVVTAAGRTTRLDRRYGSRRTT